VVSKFVEAASDALRSNAGYSGEIDFDALKIRRGSPLVGVQLPLPAPSTFGVSRLRSLRSDSPSISGYVPRAERNPPMNRRVSVWKYVRLKNGRWRYCKPAVAKNGKIKADWVIVKGKHQRHLEGTFYLHRYDRNKEIWRKIGPKAQEALDAAESEMTYLPRVFRPSRLISPNLSIEAASHGWLEEVKLSTRPETYELYEHTVREFRAWNSNGGPRHRFMADFSRLDFLTY